MSETNIDKKSNKNFFSSMLTKNYFFCFLIIVLSFALDRISKIKIIEHQLTNNSTYINDFINFNLLTTHEKNYLFKYHLEVYSKISKYLKPNERKWLSSFI